MIFPLSWNVHASQSGPKVREGERGAGDEDAARAEEEEGREVAIGKIGTTVEIPNNVSPVPAVPSAIISST